jgi:hypothetical protein
VLRVSKVHAADAVTGKTLWSFQANANWHASPMAYQFDGQEYFAIAAGDDILSFGLIEEPSTIRLKENLRCLATFCRSSWR